MPLFLSEEEYERSKHDGALVAEKADSFIRELYNQLETVKAQADAASITAEQTCSLLEQKYVSLSSEFTYLQSQYSQLNSSLDQRLSELAQLQADKHQIYLQSIGKDGEIERLSMEASEFHKSKRQLLELLEQKDIEISEKNVTNKSYLDKIVNLTDNAAMREARLRDAEAELARSIGSCARLSQEKELIERHNVWLNDELTAKVNSFNELRRTHNEVEADMTAKLADVEKKYSESSSTLKRKHDRVKELELQLTSLQEELCSSKDTAAATEEQFQAEISTVTKLVELYKESSEEWSKKAGELEGVIKALETHMSQVESDYNERFDNEVSARKEYEKEAACLKEKLDKCEAELESARNSNEMNLLTLSSPTKTWVNSVENSGMVEDNHMLVPAIPLGVSGTALAASLLRDGWSLAKMYAKYQEAVDALRHEELGRKQSEAILERVLYEIEEKAGVILDERAEHERLVDAYSAVNQKLQHSLSEQTTLQKSIQELKADLRRHERDYDVAQKEIVDLQKQVTVLLKECRDIQLRCGSASHDYDGDVLTSPANQFTAEFNAQKIISERLLTFKDINGLVEQSAQLRSLVRKLSDQIENKEVELKENFEMELQKRSDEAASKVDAVLARAEEQGRMIESLHTSVAMYKRLYEEEHKLHSSIPLSPEAVPENGRKDVMLLLEGSQEAAKKAHEQVSTRVSCLEEELAKSRSEIVTLRLERDKLSLEANFVQEKLSGSMKEFEHQRGETNSLITRNVEFSQLIIDYQRKVRESSESLQVAEELSRKLSMEVSVLKHEKEMLINSERRACDEVRSLSERVHRLQATLETIQSTEEVREEARGIERRKQEEYTRQIEKEWAEAKKDLQEERDNARTLRLEREGSMNNSMRQVEEMGKELANTLHAVAAAEARAAVAEARCSDLEKKINSSEIKASSSKDGEFEASTDEVVANLRTAKEEIDKLREEVQVNKDHMLQYKGIAQVNESALKHMEVAHENFKVEAAKVKKSLESEVLSLRERINELEAECSFKRKEAASVAAGQKEALSSSLSEIVRLKEESSLKMSQIAILETQLSAVKDNLEKEQQKWRTAQTNYERQVILQSETIQELTKTSQALASLQEEASHLHNVTNSLEVENNELKAKWETEKSMLEKSKNDAEKKYSEINEQNKILHSRLEALHIKLAERDHGLAGKASGNIGQDSPDDAGLQNVVNYLRRSKEIAETEISLLKQEKLRLQAQLESAIKTAETTQASLRAERANSRALLYTDEEFKSLQLQVREMNLLRESNIQLREENRLNFDECQKLREAAQKARNETENLETLLAASHTEVEALKKEIEMQQIKREHLEKRVDELLERCKNISVEDYDRMREDVQQMQVNSKEKDSQLEEIKKSLFEKQEVISHLEQDLARSRTELDERETRINYVLKLEESLKSDVDKQRRFIAQLKKKSENLLKEKQELSKENQALSKQLEDSKQQGKRNIVDAAGEQASREKEKEKDTRIQILEKTLERHREELRKQKDDNKMEKAQRLKNQKTITDLYGPITQERTKLEDELKKHKHALKILSDEVEKLKHANSSQTEGTSIQVLPGTLLDDMAAAYLLAIDNFERVAHPIVNEVEHPTPADPSLPADTTFSGATSGQTVPLLAPSIPSQAPPGSILSAKTAEERERVSLTKTYVEPRKTGRKLVRPRILNPEEPQADVEMSEMEESNNEGKTLSSQNIETQGNLSLPSQPSTRKRQSTSEFQEELLVPQESISDLAAHVPKKSRGSDSLKEGAESQSSALVEIHKIQPAVEESADDVGSLPQDFKEEAGGSGRDETEIAAEQADGKNEIELQNEIASGEENFDRPSEIVVADDQPILEAEQEESLAESGSDREEGELATDIADLEGAGAISNISGSPETGEIQSEDVGAPVSSPGIIDETVVPVTDDIDEVSSPQVLEDDKNEEGEIMEETTEPSDKLTSGTDQAAVDIEQAPATLDTVERTSTSSVVDVGVTNQGTVVATHTEVSQMSPVATSSSTGEQVSPAGNNTSTTINLNARARERAMLRQAGVLSSSVPRGRGRATLRGRAGRGFRGGRGSTSGQQG